ncbi:hypothetical protein DERF_014780 [Dermatophagoides farinae]|uniref:Uncharacterized protein n=1 Tax=Dermatophagoides farinae TaxID=6954 RepID=A0A922HNL1_DERFA|nr:hypothetical protein DERF_014780 [Dermatophagoides farinae]
MTRSEWHRGKCVYRWFTPSVYALRLYRDVICFACRQPMKSNRRSMSKFRTFDNSYGFISIVWRNRDTVMIKDRFSWIGKFDKQCRLITEPDFGFRRTWYEAPGVKSRIGTGVASCKPTTIVRIPLSSWIDNGSIIIVLTNDIFSSLIMSKICYLLAFFQLDNDWSE